jgi:hypothetical protein
VAKKPLIVTNPYLRDAHGRSKALSPNVSSNTSVETGRKSKTIARTLSRAERTSPVKTRQRSGR